MCVCVCIYIYIKNPVVHLKNEDNTVSWLYFNEILKNRKHESKGQIFQTDETNKPLVRPIWNERKRYKWSVPEMKLDTSLPTQKG